MPTSAIDPTNNELSLPEALLEARRAHGAAPGYHALWSAVVRGDVPAERVGKRYMVKREALRGIAELALPRPRVPRADA
jgi:hypothetical protein